jgi:glutamate synthase domain-containing protein 2
MYPEEEKVAKKFNENFIMQWTPQRMGNDIDTISKAKAIIINLSVPFHRSMYSLDEFLDIVDEKGGLIAAETFGHQPHLDLETASDLKKHVELLREATDYKFPIMVKIPSENVYGTTKAALSSDCDAVIIDTSINPYSTLSIMNGDYGTTTVASVPPALKAFRELKAQKKGIKLLVTGGFRNGADILKMIALGVDGVGISESASVAIGCNLCGECFELQCEKGIVTRDEALKAKFKWKGAGKQLANFISAIKLEMEVLLDYIGVSSLKEVNERHIMALTYDSAAISGVKLIGYDRELPMWFH